MYQPRETRSRGEIRTPASTNAGSVFGTPFSLPRPLEQFVTREFTPPRVKSPRGKKVAGGVPPMSSSSSIQFDVRGGKKDFNVQDEMDIQHKKREEKDLRSVFKKIDENEDDKICPADIEKMLGKLGYKTAKDEVDDMLWEVDDDVCGYLNLANFIRMYYRIRESTIESEPRALFMLVEFLLFDKNGSGTVDFDEATDVFRTRYGKAAMEKVVAILEEQGRERGKDVQLEGITYSEFLHNDRLVQALL
jgi:calmodulin